ncbi:MAG TPA: biotin/lipoyl-containing protein, partial [Solirubrobacteraceae bacterium]|nr:biotin/lipoyl-containing protein [Solirubrobacteraceae bacterium]
MAVDTSTVQVVMPAMGDSVSEGTVLEWHKAVGDRVEADETIVEISTDKVDAEVPSPVAGTIVRILASEGDTVSVGAALAEISTNGSGGHGGAATIAAPVTAEAPPATPEEAVAGAVTEAAGTAAAQAVRGQTIDIVTPTGGESVTEGTILKWTVKVGDTLKEGDTVVEISTDKVDMELPAPASGTISEILFAEGDTVSVGQVIARMQAGAPATATPTPQPGAPESGALAAGRERDLFLANMAKNASPSTGEAAASPVARRVAAREGVELGSIPGTARGGRITKADVLAATGNGATAAPPPAAAQPAPAPAPEAPAPPKPA